MEAFRHDYAPDRAGAGGTAVAVDEFGATGAAGAGCTASALITKCTTVWSSTVSVAVVRISTGCLNRPEFCMCSAKSVTEVSDIARPSTCTEPAACLISRSHSPSGTLELTVSSKLTGPRFDV